MDTIPDIDKKIRDLSIQLHELQERRIDILSPESDRYCIKDVNDKDSFKLWEKQMNAFWIPSEIDLSSDLKDYRTLSDKEKKVLDACLSFLSRADMIMIEALETCLFFTSNTPEEKMFYSIQSAVESIHSQSYKDFIFAIEPLESKREELFAIADNLESAKMKAKWMEKYMKSNASIPTLVLVYTCSEGIFFLTPFNIQFWFKSKNKLKGILEGNELISRDENIHLKKGEAKYRSFDSCPVYSRLSDEEAQKIVSEAVELEIAFTKEILPEPIEDLYPEDIIRYIKVLGDRILINCGHKSLYNEDISKIPSYMSNGSMAIKTNFYELRVGQYTNNIKGSDNCNPYSDDYYSNI